MILYTLKPGGTFSGQTKLGNRSRVDAASVFGDFRKKERLGTAQMSAVMPTGYKLHSSAFSCLVFKDKQIVNELQAFKDREQTNLTRKFNRK